MKITWLVLNKRLEHLQNVLYPKFSSYFQHTLSKEHIHMVNSKKKLSFMLDYMKSSKVEILSMDCEWRPTLIKGETENPIAIIQVATREKAFLVDHFTFRRIPNYQYSDEFFEILFISPNIRRLGIFKLLRFNLIFIFLSNDRICI